MTVITLRPNATDAAGSFSAVPSGTLNGVTSDDSDSTYALGSGALNNPMVLGLGSLALASDQRVKLFQVRTRWSSNNANAAGGTVLLNSGGLAVFQSLDAFAGTSPATYLTGWRTPTAEVRAIDISDAVLRVTQTVADSSAGLRIYELYVDLDVRTQPVIDSFSVTVTLGEPTYNLAFTYGTSSISETVLVQLVITDEDGGTTTLTAQPQSSDFSNYAVSIPHGTVLPAGAYTVTATVIAGGFVAPNTSFASNPVTIEFNVFPAGVNPPVLTCATDQSNQLVTLEISQSDESSVTPTTCLNIESFTGAAVNGVDTISGTAASGEDIRHIAFWINDILVTADITVDGPDWEITYDSTVMDLGPGSTYRVVIATEGSTPAGTATIVSQQLNGPATIAHNLNTRDIIVQAYDTQTNAQAVTGATALDANTISVPGPFSALTTIVLLVYDPAATACVGTFEYTVPAGGGTFGRPFSANQTIATTVQDTVVVETEVLLYPGLIEISNPTSDDLTVWVSGALAEFDDPNAVRVEVQRDRELIPLDGLNGALVPAPEEGTLTVVDRFPIRFADPEFCADESSPVGPTYRVRFYGLVEGIPSYSAWAECTPDPLYTNGQALLRHPYDPELDIEGCVSAENFQRTRPFNWQQPLDGGIPFSRTGAPSGRNFSITIEASDSRSMLAVDDLLAAPYIWYSPLDVSIPALWVAPDATTSFGGYAHTARPWQISQSLIETEPEEVTLPPMGPPNS